MFCYLTYPEGKPATTPFSSTPRILWDDIVVSRYSECATKLQNHTHISIDCIGVEVDRECQLQAVGIFVGEGLTTCKISFYKVENDVRKLLKVNESLQIERAEISEDPVKVDLREPVIMLPGQSYQIEVDQDGPPSKKLKNGKVDVKVTKNEMEICFRWHDAQVESESTVKSGNIPCIWVRVFSGKL